MRDPRPLIVFAIACATGVVVLLWMLYQVREQLLLVYVSGLFATGLAPLVRVIERRHLLPIGSRRLPRAAAILVIYAAVIGLLGGLVAMVLPPLVAQGRQLWSDLPARVDAVQQQLVDWRVVPETVTLKDLLQRAPPGSADVVTGVLGALWSFVGGVVGAVTILLLTFYLLVEAQSVFDTFVRLFPPAERARVAAVSERVAGKVSAWLAGQMLLGLIIGVTTALGLALMGVPYFYVLALIAGIGELVPMVGPLLAAIPAVIVAFTVAPGLALAVAAFFIVQQAVENNVLVPRIMGQQVGLSAVTVIVALAIGSELLGLVGAILAVPTAAIIQVLVEELVLRPEEA